MPKINTVILHPTPCQTSSLAIAEEVLDTANRLAAHLGVASRFNVQVLKPAQPEEPEAVKAADLVILPGLGLATPRELDATAQTKDFHHLLQMLRQVNQTKSVIAAACSGVFVLGRAGLLDGRKATCPWWLAPLLQEQFPKARISTKSILEEDENLITAGAAFSQIDLMVHLVERFMGHAVAEDCRRFLMADLRPSQQPYVSVSTLVARDPGLQQAEMFVRQQMANPLTISDLANAAGLGERTFARRLKAHANLTPIAFLQSLRVSEALRLAQTSLANTDEIAHRVGYSDASALRRIVHKHMGRGLDSFRR